MLVESTAIPDVKIITTKKLGDDRGFLSFYPTPARRPANSRLHTEKLHAVYAVHPPHWRASLASCVARLMAGG